MKCPHLRGLRLGLEPSGAAMGTLNIKHASLTWLPLDRCLGFRRAHSSSQERQLRETSSALGLPRRGFFVGDLPGSEKPDAEVHAVGHWQKRTQQARAGEQRQLRENASFRYGSGNPSCESFAIIVTCAPFCTPKISTCLRFKTMPAQIRSVRPPGFQGLIRQQAKRHRQVRI
jgi:hypothetical protein